jgi:hypothetical protein
VLECHVTSDLIFAAPPDAIHHCPAVHNARSTWMGTGTSLKELRLRWIPSPPPTTSAIFPRHRRICSRPSTLISIPRLTTSYSLTHTRGTISVKHISFFLSLFTSQFDEHTDEGCYVIENQTGTARNLINGQVLDVNYVCYPCILSPCCNSIQNSFYTVQKDEHVIFKYWMYHPPASCKPNSFYTACNLQVTCKPNFKVFKYWMYHLAVCLFVGLGVKQSLYSSFSHF